MYDPYTEFETHVLPNGLKIHALEMKGKPWQYMGFIIHAGSRQDGPGKAGLAHFAEHLVAEHMVPNVPINKKGEFFKRNGGFAGFGTTNYESTKYSFKLPAGRHLVAEGLKIFARGIFPEKVIHAVEKQRTIIQAEYLREYSTPFSRKIFYLPYKNLLVGHPFFDFEGTLGIPDTIDKISVEDCQSFFDTYYVPQNIDVVTVGGMPGSEVISLIKESRLSLDKKGLRSKIPDYFVNMSLPVNQSVTMKIPMAEGEEGAKATHTTSALLPGSIYPTKHHMFRDLVSDIFFEELREKLQLTYHVGVRCQGYSDLYIFKINVEFKHDEALTKFISDSVSLLTEKIHLEGVRFLQLQEASLARYKLMDQSNQDIFTNAISSIESYGEVQTIEQSYVRMQELKFDDVLELTRYFAPERIFTNIITP